MPKNPAQADAQTPSQAEKTAPTTDASATASPTQAQPPTVDMHDQAQLEASRENQKRDFFERVAAARASQQPVEYVPPPIPQRIQETTNAEMAAGAALVAKRAAQDAERAPPAKEKWDGDTVSVFRPADYVPDPKKNTGHVQARNLSG